MCCIGADSVDSTISVTLNHGRTDARTDGQRHGRTTRKHIASNGAYRRRRLNKNTTCSKPVDECYYLQIGESVLDHLGVLRVIGNLLRLRCRRLLLGHLHWSCNCRSRHFLKIHNLSPQRLSQMLQNTNTTQRIGLLEVARLIKRTRGRH